jgi:GTP-binding protein
LKISAEFITSAAGAADFPNDGLPEVALVGRSNVGKSSLLNALLRQRVARTSAAPGKTRLANVYRVARGSSSPFYLIDLPGFGYARAVRQGENSVGPGFDEVAEAAFARHPAALLLVDVRHPGLENDRAAWRWLSSTVERRAIVGTKIDKLARGQRIRALREIESVFEDSVLPVSAVTGEGLDELWNLIDSLVNRRNRNSRPSPISRRPPRPTARSQEQPPTGPTKQPLPRKK